MNDNDWSKYVKQNNLVQLSAYFFGHSTTGQSNHGATLRIKLFGHSTTGQTGDISGDQKWYPLG